MESDLPTPIDDSLPFIHTRNEEMEEEEIPVHQRQQYYYVPQQQQQQPFEYFPKKRNGGGDIFTELDKIHWIIFLSAILLAFFMGKSISTPIIIKSV